MNKTCEDSTYTLERKIAELKAARENDKMIIDMLGKIIGEQRSIIASYQGIMRLQELINVRSRGE